MAYPSTVDFGATESDLLNWTRNGQAFVATTGNLVTATNANLTVGGMCIYNPANSGKSILIYSLQTLCSNNSLYTIYRGTSDEAFGASITPLNASPGLTTTSAVTCDSSASGVTASVTKHGTLYMTPAYSANTPSEVLTNGAIILLQNGFAESINVYPFVTTAGNSFAVNARWIEF